MGFISGIVRFPTVFPSRSIFKDKVLRVRQKRLEKTEPRINECVDLIPYSPPNSPPNEDLDPCLPSVRGLFFMSKQQLEKANGYNQKCLTEGVIKIELPDPQVEESGDSYKTLFLYFGFVIYGSYKLFTHSLFPL